MTGSATGPRWRAMQASNSLVSRADRGFFTAVSSMQQEVRQCLWGYAKSFAKYDTDLFLASKGINNRYP
jgi:hypothetical protein